MHEMSLSKRILEIVEEQYARQKFERIKIIYIELGELMAVDKQALLFSFTIIAKGSIAEEAKLQFIDIPGEAWCEGCHKAIQVKRYISQCETCGVFSSNIICGNELHIKTMEVE